MLKDNKSALVHLRNTDLFLLPIFIILQSSQQAQLALALFVSKTSILLLLPTSLFFQDPSRPIWPLPPFPSCTSIVKQASLAAA
jgi:hypothetical protein